MAGQWDAAKAQALKILGKSAKIPEPKGSIDKSRIAWDKAFGDFDKARKELEAKIVEMQNANSAATHALTQLNVMVADSEFGLDSKNKDDAKKIDQAKKILTDFIDDILKKEEATNAALEMLDRMVISGVGKVASQLKQN